MSIKTYVLQDHNFFVTEIILERVLHRDSETFNGAVTFSLRKYGGVGVEPDGLSKGFNGAVTFSLRKYRRGH